MKCIIVDDEPIARMGIHQLLQEYSDIEVVGSFNQAKTALSFLQSNEVDLILLDIEMNGMTGIELARTLATQTMLIFITAHPEYATESYEVDAIDYLVKPIHSDRFHKAIRKAFDYLNLLKQANNAPSLNFSADYILVRSERQFVKIEHKNILFIEGLKDYVIIHLPNSRIITNMNLKTIHGNLPNDIFIRVSKSYIVNKNYINAYDNNIIKIFDNEIPIGSKYLDDFRQLVIANKK
ncbi:LytR/AlgR family response regulator transcription factor [Pinibacter soli]|uniref:LytTR family DNA-binding domain-containing protein n=1 Tax=Pinibacter soli TaxID=3044211 RepID=A0ABT6RE51_9BACT|nr:LytTR family DNA-binding domain-containing protein [Pinibacter soli]MDI3320846.1 LytTR family DNA-binding domain-containing protein [Pinibacter soli]